MHAIKTTIRDRRIELQAPEGLPDGTEVLVDVIPLTSLKIGIDESEWRDDAETLADWDAWLKSIEPFEFSPEEEAAFKRFDEEFRRYNLEAVRQQMEKEPLP